MGLRDGYPQVMEWMSTLDAMKAAGTCIRASCQSCREWHDVDLDEMIRQLGSPNASLWDRSPPCERDGCKGSMLFLASPGPGTPFRPLISPDVPSDGALPIQALMDGWVGRRPRRRFGPRR